MITFTQGNLLDATVDAMVNTVNTVGVMGKGIALMFKERFPENFRLYSQACKDKQLKVGHVFATRANELEGPRWIVNFPTKQHWRAPSRLEWVREGLVDLKAFIERERVESIAIPPLGAGNGGLEWADVRKEIEQILAGVDARVIVYEPTEKYQNVAKRTGVEKLTPARALIAELVRRYWVLGIECTQLEIQKLAWFLEHAIHQSNLVDPLDLRFEPHKYGPYADRLRHLLNGLDGSYLHCDKRISDAGPLDVIWFDDRRKDHLQAYLNSEAKDYKEALERTLDIIDGFESPYGLELLATVDWLLTKEHVEPSVESVREGLSRWPVAGAGERKLRLFDEKSLDIALHRLVPNVSVVI